MTTTGTERRLAALSSRWGLVALLLLFTTLIALFWVGFIGSDDTTFAYGAYGWIEQFPYVGGHGTIRYPITIPMALSFLAFGGNEIAMALPSFLYMVGALILAWFAIGNATARNQTTRAPAFFALLLAVTCPLFVIQASIANVDMVELFWQFASFALFWYALDDPAPAKKLFLSGVTAGIGFLTRETAIFIAVFYALLFFTGYRIHRKYYLWIIAGFLSVWALELLYLGLMTGDPFYRINISLHHDSTIDRSVDLAGNLIVHPLVDPLLVLLFNQEFMLLFWVAIPASIMLVWRGAGDSRSTQFVRLLALFGLVIFVLIGAVQTLLPLNPRYFTVPAFVAALLLGIALSRWIVSFPRTTLLLLALLLGTNLLGSYVENPHSQYASRTYARLVGEQKQIIYTDPMTRKRANLLLKWEGPAAETNAQARPPAAGQLYFWNPVYASTPNALMDASAAPSYARPTGIVIGRYKPQPNGVLRLIEAVGLRPLIPASIWHKLAERHVEVELIKVETVQPNNTETVNAGR